MTTEAERVAAPVASAVARPAGFWRRYAAYSLDFALLATLAAALRGGRLEAGWQLVRAAATRLSDGIGQQLADALLTGTSPTRLAAVLQHDPAIVAAAQTLQAALLQLALAWWLAYLVLAAVWHIAGECSPWEGSPGKHLLGLRVVDRAGGRIGPVRAGGRFVAGAASWLTLNLGHLLAAVPPQRRALHDYLAGTRVLATGDPGPLPGWARAWLALQVGVLVAAAGWLLVRDYLALQAAVVGLA